jgi:uncharacterized protein YggT (Ycf19 family)
MSFSFHNVLIQLLQLFLAVVAFFLGLRFILRLLAANSSTPFVSWVYSVSDTLISPFRGIFVNPVVEGGSIFDIVTLIALLFYTLLVYFLIALVDAVTRPHSVHEH